VHVALFTAERPEAHGIRALRLEGCRPVDHGLVAISVAVFRGVRSPALGGPGTPGCYDWLGDREPVAQPGYSILVFDLDAPARRRAAGAPRDGVSSRAEGKRAW
jgi:hypothetical protein